MAVGAAIVRLVSGSLSSIVYSLMNRGYSNTEIKRKIAAKGRRPLASTLNSVLSYWRDARQAAGILNRASETRLLSSMNIPTATGKPDCFRVGVTFDLDFNDDLPGRRGGFLMDITGVKTRHELEVEIHKRLLNWLSDFYDIRIRNLQGKRSPISNITIGTVERC